MKFSSIRHLIFEGLKNIWDNRLMSLASIGVLMSCMALIGAAMLVTFNVDKAMKTIENENVVMAYLNDYNSVKYSEENAKASKNGKDAKVPESAYLVHNDQEAELVCEELRHVDNVLSVEYITADEGIDRVVGMISEDQAKYIKMLRENGENPLSAAAKITMRDLSKFDTTVEKIKQVDGVYSLSSQRDVAKRITSIKNAITTASYIIIAVLMVIALVIVCNTIRVTMFNRKLEISIMKAVGATNAFIRLPFVVEGIVIGLLSAGLTLGLLYLGYQGVLTAMEGVITNPVPYSDYIVLFILIFTGVGVLSGIIGSMFMINKYLRKEGSEFSALS